MFSQREEYKVKILIAKNKAVTNMKLMGVRQLSPGEEIHWLSQDVILAPSKIRR